MLQILKQFNDSKRVYVAYGGLFVTLLLLVPFTALSVMLLISGNGAAVFGVGLLVATGTAARKMISDMIAQFKEPTDAPENPSNLWFPIVILALGFMLAYAEYGAHGAVVKGWLERIPEQVFTRIMPFSEVVFDLTVPLEPPQEP